MSFKVKDLAMSLGCADPEDPCTTPTRPTTTPSGCVGASLFAHEERRRANLSLLRAQLGRSMARG